MRQYLSAQQVQAANQIPLKEVVDAATLRNLKARDEHPSIRLYSIGHEGEANLHLPGLGETILTWVQGAVRAIADKLKIGTAVFDRHNPDTNSHEGRTQIGEVVGKTVKQIGDRLNTLAAIYIYPQFESRPLDIASFEAEIEFDHDGNKAWPTNIRNVSGIALANSGTEIPGFPGATLVGAVQAYVQAFRSDKGDNTMNLSDVKSAVKELGLKPTQVFEIGDIMGDSAVGVKVKEVTKEHFVMANRVGEERDALREKVSKLENQNAENEKKLQQQTVQSKSSSVLDAVLADPERKFDIKAKIFVKRNYRNFNSSAEDEAALKVDVVKFVDENVKEFGELVKELGLKPDGTPNNPTEFKLPDNLIIDGQNQSTDTKKQFDIPPAKEEVLTEEMDPKLNPLIPGGEAAKEALKT